MSGLSFDVMRYDMFCKANKDINSLKCSWVQTKITAMLGRLFYAMWRGKQKSYRQGIIYLLIWIVIESWAYFEHINDPVNIHK